MKNPITSVIGLIVVICPIIGELFPETKEICDRIILELVGLGLIASADGIKKAPKVESGPTVSSWFIPIGLILAFSTITACAQIDRLAKSVIDTVEPLVQSVEEAIDTVKETALNVVTPNCQDGETPEANGCEIHPTNH